MAGTTKSSNIRNNNNSSTKSNRSKSVKYRMRLFIADNEPNSVIAQNNITQICESHLNENYQLDIIDVFEDYSAALAENILVTPALIIDEPKKGKIFGNLKNEDKVLSALELI